MKKKLIVFSILMRSMLALAIGYLFIAFPHKPFSSISAQQVFCAIAVILIYFTFSLFFTRLGQISKEDLTWTLLLLLLIENLLGIAIMIIAIEHGHPTSGFIIPCINFFMAFLGLNNVND